ncbi:uncharacterized protein BJ171DRAFT_498115 [Polychytrium aggregatum]|uniref:uncharacterized protein n=1 Tax=Polychytrium aggregatum TaxID=110093 RepID=UPI0022FE3804|nr:uncharacterized protein BJ171DRAFT_498115 [Polychytrium aggregatum]KAI9206540.1 hypothetical protein BJ171DRAFT_498115 [Polychytrium aggregatum]
MAHPQRFASYADPGSFADDDADTNGIDIPDDMLSMLHRQAAPSERTASSLGHAAALSRNQSANVFEQRRDRQFTPQPNVSPSSEFAVDYNSRGKASGLRVAAAESDRGRSTPLILESDPDSANSTGQEHAPDDIPSDLMSLLHSNNQVYSALGGSSPSAPPADRPKFPASLAPARPDTASIHSSSSNSRAAGYPTDQHVRSQPVSYGTNADDDDSIDVPIDLLASNASTHSQFLPARTESILDSRSTRPSAATKLTPANWKAAQLNDSSPDRTHSFPPELPALGDQLPPPRSDSIGTRQPVPLSDDLWRARSESLPGRPQDLAAAQALLAESSYRASVPFDPSANPRTDSILSAPRSDPAESYRLSRQESCQLSPKLEPKDGYPSPVLKMPLPKPPSEPSPLDELPLEYVDGGIDVPEIFLASSVHAIKEAMPRTLSIAQKDPRPSSPMSRVLGPASGSRVSLPFPPQSAGSEYDGSPSMPSGDFKLKKLKSHSSMNLPPPSAPLPPPPSVEEPLVPSVPQESRRASVSGSIRSRHSNRSGRSNLSSSQVITSDLASVREHDHSGHDYSSHHKDSEGPSTPEIPGRLLSDVSKYSGELEASLRSPSPPLPPTDVALSHVESLRSLSRNQHTIDSPAPSHHSVHSRESAAAPIQPQLQPQAAPPPAQPKAALSDEEELDRLLEAGEINIQLYLKLKRGLRSL